MFHLTRHLISIVFFVCFVSLIGCTQNRDYPYRPITLVCPWATGGGTDRVSRQIAIHLESELGVPVNVINATGGKGVTGHSRGLGAKPDGYTVLMATLELNMMHWSGLTSMTYEDCIPLMSLNEDYAALFVRADAPWKTLKELEDAIRSEPGKLKCSGTSIGGAWHLAVAGWMIEADMNVDDVLWISSTGAGPSIQELLSGGVDMVCCSLPEVSSQYKSGQLRALGVMSPNRAAGYEKVETFKEQGRDWSLGGWRGIAVAPGTPQEVVDVLLTALDRIVTGKTEIEGLSFPAFMETQGFDHTWRRTDDFRDFLVENDEKFGALLTSEAMTSVNRDPFHSMAFPGGLVGLIVLSLACSVVFRSKETLASQTESDSARGVNVSMTGFVVILAAGVFYFFAVEELGFVITAALILLATLSYFRTNFFLAAIIASLAAPAIYHVFGVLLRVPLPQGLLGW